MKRLLKIEIDHNNLYRNTIVYVAVSFVALIMVYFGLGYYFFITGNGMMVILYVLSFVLSNAAFVSISIQFQVLIYSLYLRFSMLNGFVE